MEFREEREKESLLNQISDVVDFILGPNSLLDKTHPRQRLLNLQKIIRESSYVNTEDLYTAVSVSHFLRQACHKDVRVDTLYNTMDKILNGMVPQIDLPSPNRIKELYNLSPDDTKIPKQAFEKILNAHREVMKNKLQHLRLDKLIELRHSIAPYKTKNKLLGVLYDRAYEMACMITNSAAHEIFQNRLQLRRVLGKYKHDFIGRMPPANSPDGELLNDILRYENTRDPLCRHRVMKDIFQKAGFSDSKISVPCYVKNPRLFYKAALGGYTLNAIARTDIRTVYKTESRNDVLNEINRLSLHDSEVQRLYPSKKYQAFYTLQMTGSGDNSAISFIPANTMNRNAGHINMSFMLEGHVMLVISPSGDFYACSKYVNIKHSSLHHLAYYAGTIKMCQGRTSEIGSFTGHFRTSELNFRNGYRYLCEVGALNHRDLPQFFLDCRNGRELGLTVLERARHQLIRLLHPDKKYPVTGRYFEGSALHKVDRTVVNVEAFHKRHDNFPVVKPELAQLYKGNPKLAQKLLEYSNLNYSAQENQERRALEEAITAALKEKFNITVPKAFKVTVKRHPTQNNKIFYQILRKTPARNPSNYYKRSVLLCNLTNNINKQYADYAVTDLRYHNQTKMYKRDPVLIENHLFAKTRKQTHFLNDQVTPKIQMIHFWTGEANRRRSRKNWQNTLNKLRKSYYLGWAATVLAYSIYIPYVFTYYLGAFSLTYVAIMIGVCALASALIKEVFYTEHSDLEDYSSLGVGVMMMLTVTGFLLLTMGVLPPGSLRDASMIASMSLVLVGILVHMPFYIIDRLLDKGDEENLVKTSDYSPLFRHELKQKHILEARSQTEEFITQCEKAKEVKPKPKAMRSLFAQ